MDNQQEITNRLLKYLIFMLEILSIDSKIENYSTKPILEYVFDKISNTTTDGRILLISKLLRTLFFTLHCGYKPLIIEKTVSLMQLLDKYTTYSDCMLCMQELFVGVFAKKDVFYSIYIASYLKPKQREITLFQLPKKKEPLPVIKPETNIISNETLNSQTLKKILDIFEPLILREMKKFHNTHSKELKNTILFMLSRMVCIGVDFKRLNRDNSFIRNLIENFFEFNHQSTIYYAMEFFSFLYFLIKFESKVIYII